MDMSRLSMHACMSVFVKKNLMWPPSQQQLQRDSVGPAVLWRIEDGA